MIVIRIAITPSLKASSRALVTVAACLPWLYREIANTAQVPVVEWRAGMRQHAGVGSRGVGGRVPEQKRRRRHRSRGRAPLHVRFAGAIRRFLFPRPTVRIGLPHAEHGRRGQIIGFAIALALLVITALTVIAVEGGLSGLNPVPAEE
jgi:hypothetical protein